MEFIADNQYDLLPKMRAAFCEHGVMTPSRNGTTVRLPGVTTVCLKKPHQRVFIMPARDSNPFFHLVEAMAMLAGRNSVELLTFFAKNMASFSDDSIRYNAFYGERARVKWGDQINKAIETLQTDRDSRQVVVNLWDPADLGSQTNDKACNLMMLFSIRDGCLDMTTFNRSNDAVWGYLTGANMVHFPFFQEYVANRVEMSIGHWWHCSNNMHVYEWQGKWATMSEALDVCPAATFRDPYAVGAMRSKPLQAWKEGFDLELHRLLAMMEGKVAEFQAWSNSPREFQGLANGFTLLQNDNSPHAFLNMVFVPVFNAYMTYKIMRSKCLSAVATDEEIYKAVLPYLTRIGASDWQAACTAWMIARLPALTTATA
jgi:hypothetical protein